MKEETKKRTTKQPGYTWGTTCIMVDDAEKAIETYTSVFGFTVDNSMKDKSGATSWAKLSYKDFGMHICDSKNSTEDCRKYKSPKILGVLTPVSIYLYNDDVEGICKKAKAHGLEIMKEPEVMFWGDKMCTILDENGYIWNIAKNVADFDASKMPS